MVSTTQKITNQQCDAVDEITTTQQKHLDSLLESLGQSGCEEVNRVIKKLAAGDTPTELEGLSYVERDYIYKELKSIMAVYDEKVCSTL